MDEIIIGNRSDMQVELRQRGFENVDEMINTGQALYTTEHSRPSGLYVTQLDPAAAATDASFGFTFNKTGHKDSWILHHANYSVSVNSGRMPNGLLKVSRNWNAYDDQIPHKEYMRWVGTKAAKIEAAKESFLLNSTQANVIPEDAGHSLPITLDLANELKRLGFEETNQLSKTAIFKDNLTFLSTQEKATSIQPPGLQTINFFFAIVYREYEIPPHVEYIHASIPGDNRSNDKVMFEKAYWRNEGELPAKAEIVRELLRTLRLEENRLTRASDVNRLIQNKNHSKGMRI